MVRRLFLYLMVVLPLVTTAQNKPLTPKQSKAHLKALKELSKYYDFDYYVGNDTYIAEKVVNTKKRFGLVNIKGKELLSFEYGWVEPIGNCNLLACFKDSLVGFANCMGHIVTPLQYDAYRFDGEGGIWSYGGMLAVRQNGKEGIIDTNGRIVVPLIYEDSYLYLCPNAPFFYIRHYVDNTESFIRYNGDKIITAEDVLYMTDGVIRVTRNGLMGLYDTNGREIVKCQYEWFDYLPNNGLYTAKQDGHWMLVDLEGKKHFANALRHINDSNHVSYGASGFIFHQDNRMCGAIDTNGNTVIPLDPKYSYVEYNDSEHIVMSNEEFDTAYIFDRYGHLQDIYSYDDCSYYCNSSYTVVQKNGLYGLVDSNWNIVMPFKFKESLWLVDSNHFSTQFEDGIQGLIDIKGNIIFKAPCQDIFPLGNGIYRITATDSKNRDNSISGFADIYGNITLTQEEYATMQSWQKQPEKNRHLIIAEESNKSQAISTMSPATGSADTIEEEVFVVVEDSPKFPGGDSAMYMYLCMNLSYPDLARDNNIEGIVFASFTVERDGSISNVRILRDIGGGCGVAAAEVIKNMPRWEPGRQRGKAVRVQFNLPIRFQLKDKDPSSNNMSQEEKCNYLFNQSGYRK